MRPGRPPPCSIKVSSGRPPAAGVGAVRSAARLELRLQSSCPEPAVWARDTCATSPPLSPAPRAWEPGGGGGDPTRAPAQAARPFHGAPRGRARKTPAAPGESRGWGEPRRGRMGERKEQGEVPEGEVSKHLANCVYCQLFGKQS